MNPTDLRLTEQLKITDREIAKRLDLLQFTAEDAKALMSVKPIVAKHIDTIVEEFYEFQVNIYEISRQIGDAETLQRLKNFMRQYILSIFDGDYTRDYVQSRLRIGLVHKRIGVSPKLYIAAFTKLLSMLRNLVITSNDKDECLICSETNNAIEKIMMFDLHLVFDTYIYSLMDELERSKQDVEEYAEGLEIKIAERTKELDQLSRKDGLTGLNNHMSFYEHLRREVSRAQRTGESIALIYFDLDGFKKINDALGHAVGDEMLKTTADLLIKACREGGDIPCRYGGDEFCVILPKTPKEGGAINFAERFIKEFDAVMHDKDVTVSIGISFCTSENYRDYDEMVKLADTRMYNAKKIKGSNYIYQD